jgi:hypothetical protein
VKVGGKQNSWLAGISVFIGPLHVGIGYIHWTYWAVQLPGWRSTSNISMQNIRASQPWWSTVSTLGTTFSYTTLPSSQWNADIWITSSGRRLRLSSILRVWRGAGLCILPLPGHKRCPLWTVAILHPDVPASHWYLCSLIRHCMPATHSLDFSPLCVGSLPSTPLYFFPILFLDQQNLPFSEPS